MKIEEIAESFVDGMMLAVQEEFPDRSTRVPTRSIPDDILTGLLVTAFTMGAKYQRAQEK